MNDLARCAHGIDTSRLVLVYSSPHFSRAGHLEREDFFSGVEVMPSAALGEQNFAADASARGVRCFERLGARELAHSLSRGRDFRAGKTSAVPLALSLPRARILATRIITPLTYKRARGRLRLNSYFDFIRFESGPAQVTLVAVSLGHPVPISTERRLLEVLHSRAAV